MENQAHEDLRIVDGLDHEARSSQSRATNAEYRTHLANERTFLAWCRTSIALVVFGFVLERLDLILMMTPETMHNDSTSKLQDLHLVSLFSFALAGFIILVSGWRFLVVRTMIRRGKISLSVFPEVMVVISMAAIIAIVILLMLR